ncbi:MAG: PilZ domain-containing protein [Bradymonadales bacterium]|nr:PilZ domain-containing protein [Bradymonadales bacterium]
MTDKKVPKAAFVARKGKERRRWKRISAKIRVILKDADTFVPLITRNIDPGGLFLQTDEPKARLELVNLRIDMGKGQQPLSALGVVKHAINKARARELNRIPGMGIQFYGMSASDQARWEALVARLTAAEEESASKATQLQGVIPGGEGQPTEATGTTDSEPEPPSAESAERLEAEEIPWDEQLELEPEPPSVESAERLEAEEIPWDEQLELEPELPSVESAERIEVESTPWNGEGLADLLEGEQAADLDFLEQPEASGPPQGGQPDLEGVEIQENLADLLEGEGGEPLYELVTEAEGEVVGEPLAEDPLLLDQSGLAELLEGDTPLPDLQAAAWPAEGSPGEYEIRPTDMDSLRNFIERDIPAGGTFLSTPDRLEVGSPVHLALFHPETEEAFPIEGVVVRVLAGSGLQPGGLSIRFEGLTALHREGLEKFVIYGFNVL